MKKITLVLGSITLGLVATMPSALAQAKGYTLPPNAQEIEPGVYYIGRAHDRAGRNIDGIVFLHPRNFNARPGGRGPGGTGSKCYSFLANGARWKAVEDFVISDSIAKGPNGSTFVAQIGYSLDAWEAAAGQTIFGSGKSGNVDMALIGSGMNDENEVTFGAIDEPGVIAVTTVWGIFAGPAAGRELVEWDMILDDQDFSWSSTGEAGDMDFWNIFAHESGHAAGLGHPSNSCTEETMYAYASLGETKKRDLNAGDIAGISALY